MVIAGGGRHREMFYRHDRKKCEVSGEKTHCKFVRIVI